jgi:Ca2+-binding RTX toxin-like protein
VVNDLSGTDLTAGVAVIDLEGALGSGVGDGAVDRVTVNGTAGSDTINVSTVSGFGFIGITGASAPVAVFHAESTDQLVISGGAGNDTINASTLPAGTIGLTLDGGAGNDVLLGSQGADVLQGGDGNDFVFGDNGNDVAFLGAGDDVFQWDPGDGSDTVEGQDGVDILEFNGANIAENIDISANGGRVRFFRDIANVTMDLNDVEVTKFHALGGADNIVVNDLSGTDLTAGVAVIDLEGALGSGVGDGAVDRVTVNGTAGNDTINVSTVSGFGFIGITGASAPVAVFHAESTDQLVVNGGAGDDTINASGLAAGAIALTLNGGLGADVLIGSQGDDLVNGGDGNDLALLGAGNDTFVWNPGDDNDTIEGQAGVDILEFNGANIAENIDISANGGRVLFFRDIANVTMDLNDVEVTKFHALGGADNIVVNDLSGTDLPAGVAVIDLEGALGSGVGDGAVDRVTVNGTAGNDTINVSTVSGFGFIGITGASAPVAVFHAENTDQLFVNGGAGDDTINASGLAAGAIALTLNGGAGNDTLTGSAGNDSLIGGAGIDHLFGGASQDTFVFSGASLAALDTGAGATRDVIEDFGGDKISLANIDGNLNTAGDEAFSFIGTAAFSAAGQVRVFLDGAGNTIVEGNMDNNLGADFQIELHNFTGQLNASDFLL